MTLNEILDYINKNKNHLNTEILRTMLEPLFTNEVNKIEVEEDEEEDDIDE